MTDPELAARPGIPRVLQRALALAGVGAFMGFLLNAALGASGGALAILPVAIAGAFFVGTLFHHFLIESAGSAASRMLAGASVGASPPDYSYADSLVARGLHDGAVAAYREAAEKAGSPDPLLRAARVLRDQLRQYDRAVETLREVRSHPDAGAGLQEVVTREIVEIFVRTGEPARALPELARLAERHPDTPGGDWAKRRMTELRAELWQTVKDQTGVTPDSG